MLVEIVSLFLFKNCLQTFLSNTTLLELRSKHNMPECYLTSAFSPGESAVLLDGERPPLICMVPVLRS